LSRTFGGTFHEMDCANDDEEADQKTDDGLHPASAKSQRQNEDADQDARDDTIPGEDFGIQSFHF
jgi:hypothetical protein